MAKKPRTRRFGAAPEVLQQQGHRPFFFRLFFPRKGGSTGARGSPPTAGAGNASSCGQADDARPRGFRASPKRRHRRRPPLSRFPLWPSTGRNRFDGGFFDHGSGFNGGFVRLRDAQASTTPGSSSGLTIGESSKISSAAPEGATGVLSSRSVMPNPLRKRRFPSGRLPSLRRPVWRREKPLQRAS